jgi:hypothetical protein
MIREHYPGICANFASRPKHFGFAAAASACLERVFLTSELPKGTFKLIAKKSGFSKYI